LIAYEYSFAFRYGEYNIDLKKYGDSWISTNYIPKMIETYQDTSTETNQDTSHDTTFAMLLKREESLESNPLFYSAMTVFFEDGLVVIIRGGY